MKGTPPGDPRRAVLLLSGGLDSTLAARMMVDQGIELLALHFTSPFCTCSRGTRREGGDAESRAGCASTAHAVALGLGIPIRTVVKGPDYIEIVRNPSHGRGSAMNPCIDCRIYSLRKARACMEEIGGSFLVTGEVVGQRPMSQRSDALRLIEKHSGCRDIVLRPLSALHLPPTLPEREGWVDREKLLGIQGRSRREQIRLARDWDVTGYPCPAGGCLLTDKTFSLKVRDLLDHCPSPDNGDLNLLKVGRHFRFGDGTKAIVGRDEAENRRLEGLCRGRCAVYVAERFPGPSVALMGNADGAREAHLGRLYTRYAKAGTPCPYVVREISPEGTREVSLAHDPDVAEVDRALLG